MSLVRFRAQNHPQQTKRDDVDDRAILPEHFDPLHAEFRFTIDAAASAENAVLPRFWTMADDALTQDWHAERVWCNPPYSNLRAWVDKAWVAMLSHDCELVVMLVPANRTEQGWWQSLVEPRRDRGFIDGVRLSCQFQPTRWRFKWPADRVVPPKGDRPPFGLALLIWERADAASLSRGER